MEGSNSKRMLRLIGSLLLHPQYIKPYTKYSLSKSKEPIELELPWISFTAIKFLNNYKISDQTEILELGGGGSTLYFANKGALITCLESSDVWADKITSKINSKGLKNIDVKVLPYNYETEEEFIKSDFYKFIRNKKYDVILIDNYEENIQLRPICFYAAEKIIKPDGIIILDDSWRYPDIRKNNSAKYFKIFKSPGPSRLGVTTTDIYFY